MRPMFVFSLVSMLASTFGAVNSSPNMTADSPVTLQRETFAPMTHQGNPETWTAPIIVKATPTRRVTRKVEPTRM